MVVTNHNYSDFDHNFTVLHSMKSGKLLIALEEFNIYRAVKTDPQNVLNDSFQSSNLVCDMAMKITTAFQTGQSTDI